MIITLHHVHAFSQN